MAGPLARRLGKIAVVSGMALAGAIAVGVWFPDAKKLRKPRPDDMVGRDAPGIADEVEAWLGGDEFDLTREKPAAALLLFWHPRDGGKSQPWLASVAKLARDFAPKGLVTAGLCVVDMEDAPTLVAPLRSQYDLPFRIGLDCDGDLHMRYLIDKRKTPYCYLLRPREGEEGKWTVAWGEHPEFLTGEVIQGVLGKK